MIYLKAQQKFSLLLLLVLSALSGCGVKGDPLPPEKPVEVGRGRPTYKRATEGLRVKDKRRHTTEEDEQDERE